MDNIFHLIYSLCFYGQNLMNYNQYSEGGKNSEKTLVLKGLKPFNCGYPIVYAQSKKSGRRRATELANFFIGTHLSYVEHYLPKTHADRQSKGAEHYEIRIFLLGKKCR